MPSVVAGFIVFATTAAVLVLEILAGRMLAPYVGDTLETYTGIIGVVLAGIALGSWYGGKLADRLNPRAMLGPTVVLGGALTLLVLPLVTVVGQGLGGGGPVAIVLLSTVGFFAPAAVLSAVTPTVIKVQLGDLGHTGRVVGRLSALSTVGAIFGTFLTGFVLVAHFGSRTIVLGLGAVTVAAGVALWWWVRPRRSNMRASAATTAVLVVLAGGLTAATPVPCDYESTYYCIEVKNDSDNPSGRILWLDRLRHSYVDLADPTHLEFGYMKLFGDVLAATAPPGAPLDVLHIGGGALTLPRYVEATRPGSHSTVIELDARLVEVAKQEFGFQPRSSIDIITDDARRALPQRVDDGYDVAVGDAFGGLAVPWHLTTVEAVAQVQRSLTSHGVYMVNVIDGPPMAFPRAEAATLSRVFDHVAVLGRPGPINAAQRGNLVLLASDAPLPVEGVRRRIAARNGNQAVITGDAVQAFIGNAEVLTDNHAPVDQLITAYAR